MSPTALKSDDAEVGEWAAYYVPRNCPIESATGCRDFRRRSGHPWSRPGIPQRLHRRPSPLCRPGTGDIQPVLSGWRRSPTRDFARRVELPEYLNTHRRERVWEVVEPEYGGGTRTAILGTAEAQARNGAAGALEEDARLTALFLWTLQSTDDAETRRRSRWRWRRTPCRRGRNRRP